MIQEISEGQVEAAERRLTSPMRHEIPLIELDTEE
jgi:hypothetical protein